MTVRLLLVAWLVLVWVALWDALSVANLLSGALVAGLLLAVFPVEPRRTAKRVRPLALLRLAAYFAYKLVEANLVVAWEVVTPGSRINQGIVEVPVRGADDVLLTMLGNAISLTPGTLTLEVRRDPPTLWVHVLHVRSVEATRAEVLTLERLLLEAFAPQLAARLASAQERDATGGAG
jgi:multicomponent Na+:H+ antiporter subunit E